MFEGASERRLQASCTGVNTHFQHILDSYVTQTLFGHSATCAQEHTALGLLLAAGQLWHVLDFHILNSAAGTHFLRMRFRATFTSGHKI
eukprot:1153405-Amphidinium_carterae.1